MGSQEAEQERDGGRLPGAVRAQEGEGFPSPDVNVQVIEGEVPPVTAHDPIEAQGEVASERSITLRAGTAREREGASPGSSESGRQLNVRQEEGRQGGFGPYTVITLGRSDAEMYGTPAPLHPASRDPPAWSVPSKGCVNSRA